MPRSKKIGFAATCRTGEEVMVAWPWLILAFVVGGNVGLFILAAIVCGHISDRMMEARYEDRDVKIL